MRHKKAEGLTVGSLGFDGDGWLLTRCQLCRWWQLCRWGLQGEGDRYLFGFDVPFLPHGDTHCQWVAGDVDSDGDMQGLALA